jgi:Fur family ferric uptake transcriptional regulator
MAVCKSPNLQYPVETKYGKPQSERERTLKRKHSCENDPDFAELLRDAGLKATQPRLTIIRFLFHEHGPFTPDEIFHKVGADDMDLTTVYRTTTSLEKAGMISRCEFGDGLARYEFRGESDLMEHHHHVICRECKNVTTLEICLDDSWKKALIKMGYTNPSHALEFFGTCKSCQKSGPSL